MIRQEKNSNSLYIISILIILQIIIYFPHIGKGFITDDFIWLDIMVQDGKVDFLKPFMVTSGFFRPLVSLSFGIQYLFHGMSPLFYGWFNLLLHLLNTILVFLLLSRYLKSKPWAIGSTIFFALHTKSAPMAVGWISGRTTLLYSFFILLCFYFITLYTKHDNKTVSIDYENKESHRKWLIWASLSFFLALLSKESAVTAPLFVLIAIWIYRRSRDIRIQPVPLLKKLPKTLYFLLPFLFYILLRMNSNAFSISDAPSYYRYNLNPFKVLHNFGEYISRSILLDIVVIMILLFGMALMKVKKNIHLSSLLPTGDASRTLALGMIWFIIFLLPTLCLPSRSDIYVYLPQIGLHVVTVYFILKLLNLSGLTIPFKKQGQDISGKPVKLTANRRYVLLTLGILLTVIIFCMLYIRVSEFRVNGNISADFTKQFLKKSSSLPPDSQVYLIPMNSKNKNNPGPESTISYGFSSFLRLNHSGKSLTGSIINFEEFNRQYTDYRSSTFLFFYNAEGILVGPIQVTVFRDYVFQVTSTFFPLTPFPSTENEELRKGTERLYRLKQRKLRLLKNKRHSKMI